MITLKNRKRVKIIKRNTVQNKYYKVKIKKFSKKCFFYIKQYQITPNSNLLILIQKNLNLAYSHLDKSVKKHIFHKRFIAKKKAKLQIQFNLIK